MSGTTALLLVDCQEDYFARDGLQPPRETLVAAIFDALAAARAKGWPIFHVRTRVAKDGSDAMPHRRGAPEAVEGSAGADPPFGLIEGAGEPVFYKRFFSAFDADGLEEALRTADVERLLVAGVHSHACVQASVLDAYARGFDVVVGQDLVGSYDAAHGAQSLGWLDGRAASVRPSSAILGKAPAAWRHPNPCNADEILFEIEPSSADAVTREASRLGALAEMPLAERSAALRSWHDLLASDRANWVEALVRDVGKPRGDAEGEVAYGLALLDHVAKSLEEEEVNDRRRVRYRPVGIAGLITPWNNPFAIPVAKIAPAIGYGNAALWKPALPGSRIAGMLNDSLAESGLGDRLALVTGDAGSGQAVIANAALLSFTGSVGVGRAIIAEAGSLAIAVQAELGGSNAAIVDESADLDAAATDLAAAIFSFSGQRCTAIRRVLVLDSVYDAFAERLVAAVGALTVGEPDDAATQIGPVLDKGRQRAFLEIARHGTALVGGNVPDDVDHRGCWVAPTLMSGLPADHPLLTHEVFGPLAAVVRVPNLEAAISAHNSTDLGLLGALFSGERSSQQWFIDQAKAGILSINRARPPFAAEGPFNGWKASGYGTPEHGRWNRDFYTRAQALYGD